MSCIRIGYGVVAPLHDQKFQLYGIITSGVIDIDPVKKVKIVKDGFNLCETFEEALKLTPLFWDICTPNDQHLPVIKEILRVDPKANILVEKPVVTIDQVSELLELMKNSQLNIVVEENYLSSSIAQRIKSLALDELKLKPQKVVIEFDKNRIQDFKNGRYIGKGGALIYEGTHMFTILLKFGEQFLPKGEISKKYEDLFIPHQLNSQGLADITYQVGDVTVNLFSSMKGDIKNHFLPYDVESIPESDEKTRYRVAAIIGIDPEGNEIEVVGFYEPVRALTKRSLGVVVVIQNGVVKSTETIPDDSMGEHLKRVVEYFTGAGPNPCPLSTAIQAVTLLDPLLAESHYE